ncbi:sigma-70 family RNA polymerase sigma factor [Bhargavaea ginsengi]|uniref:sigma-70 family RNA polymerase sigma factor n=1 Tax=Bhargavaea ginsengi TaxID=426757 RepID=UPI0020420672|nr:sigma-70 family RNA polymerase sigma factor [Bhargavaea ginsengi]MCM3088261.1 sigma-70 family RNA polymerase sigma factor [Bhargavaea ginsengi]
MEERELAERSIRGDAEAFVQLMELHKVSLYRTAYAFLKSEHAAVEAVQEVTARAFRNIRRLKEPTYAKTWLTRIMINYCQDELKKARREPVTDRMPESVAHTGDDLLILEEALRTLPDPSRRLIQLKYFEDMKIKEIAEIEKIPEGTVKSRLNKTLKSLRDFIYGKGGHTDD